MVTEEDRKLSGYAVEKFSRQRAQLSIRRSMEWSSHHHRGRGHSFQTVFKGSHRQGTLQPLSLDVPSARPNSDGTEQHIRQQHQVQTHHPKPTSLQVQDPNAVAVETSIPALGENFFKHLHPVFEADAGGLWRAPPPPPAFPEEGTSEHLLKEASGVSKVWVRLQAPHPHPHPQAERPPPSLQQQQQQCRGRRELSRVPRLRRESTAPTPTRAQASNEGSGSRVAPGSLPRFPRGAGHQEGFPLEWPPRSPASGRGRLCVLPSPNCPDPSHARFGRRRPSTREPLPDRTLWRAPLASTRGRSAWRTAAASLRSLPGSARACCSQPASPPFRKPRAVPLRGTGGGGGGGAAPRKAGLRRVARGSPLRARAALRRAGAGESAPCWRRRCRSALEPLRSHWGDSPVPCPGQTQRPNRAQARSGRKEGRKRPPARISTGWAQRPASWSGQCSPEARERTFPSPP